MKVNRLGPEHSLSFVEHTYHLPNTTTLHTHGLHVSPSGIEDNVFRVLASGEQALSEYHIRTDHQREHHQLLDCIRMLLMNICNEVLRRVV